MHALMINSSARRHGNTDTALSVYADILRQAGWTVEGVHLSALNIGMCRGCRLCFDRGEQACPEKDDDVLDLYAKIKNCDVLLLGSPIYVEDVNGIMKNWIDRMAFNCHRPQLFAQKAYIVCTSGAGASWHAADTLQRALQTWGAGIIGRSKFIAGAKITPDEFARQYRQKIEADVRKILRAAPRKQPSFLQLLTFQIQKMYYQKAEYDGTYDKQFWQEQGWLGEGCAYYADVPVSRFKTGAARWIGKGIMAVVLR